MKRYILQYLSILGFAIVNAVYSELTINGIIIVSLFLLLLGVGFGKVFFDITFDEDASSIAKIIVISFIVITIYTMLELSSWSFLIVSIVSFGMGISYSMVDPILEALECYDDDDGFYKYYDKYYNDETDEENNSDDKKD